MDQNDVLNGLFFDAFGFVPDMGESSSEKDTSREVIIIEDENLRKDVIFLLGIQSDKITENSLKNRKIKSFGGVLSQDVLKVILDNGLVEYLQESYQFRLTSLENLTDIEIEIISKHACKIEITNLKGVTPELLDRLPVDRYDLAGDFYKDETQDSLEGMGSGAYTRDEILEIVNVLEKIKSGISENATELEKFLYVCKTLAMFVNYDFSAVSTDESFIEEHSTLARSLVGTLLHGKAVCHGFALALKYILNYIGIECVARVGEFLKKDGTTAGHSWNKVKIDDVWYNTDLTGDFLSIRDGENLKYGLMRDKEFEKNHIYLEKNAKYKCEKTYDMEELMEILRRVPYFELQAVQNKNIPTEPVIKSDIRAVALENLAQCPNLASTITELGEIDSGNIITPEERIQ